MIAEGLIAHLVGDYVLQSHWMATEKTQKWAPAVVHGITYTIPFLILTRSVWALLIIAGTHIVLDHYRAAKHVIWLKNQLSPKRSRPSWSEGMNNNGFASSVPAGLSTALLIVTDNTLHIVINSVALAYFA